MSKQGEMGRTERTYGLPRLTFEEAARLLGVTVGRFMEMDAGHGPSVRRAMVEVEER